MRIGNDNDDIMLSVSELGPAIMLTENNNIIVLVGSTDGDGAVITTDKHKKVTGTLPR